MFELKKVISAFMMPMPGLLLLGFFGLLLIMFTRRQKAGCIVLLFSLSFLFLASFQPVSSRLLMPLERQYPAFLPINGSVDYVMVLGNSHITDDRLPPTSQLSRTALMRLTEGIRIWRMYPGSKMILSGYAGGTSISHARMMAKVALALGVNKSDIILLETAKDTWEEARQAAAFVGARRLVLVTSASHMPRAMKEFTNAGLTPLPAPTNYLANRQTQQFWTRYLPSSRYLEQTELFWHEQLGLWWIQLRQFLLPHHEQTIEASQTEL